MTAKQKRKDFHVLSLGAGKQSTYMLIQGLMGKFGVKPNKAVFCDLGAEPDFVYRNLDNLQTYCLKEFNFTIDVLKLPPIDKHILDFVAGKVKHDNCPPFYLTGGGILARHCTTHYKIRPVRKYLSQFRPNNNLYLWIGISLDEIERMKLSSVAYYKHFYPLIDFRIPLSEIKNWFSSQSFPEPGKSSCYFCPFHSHNYWQLLKKQFPAEFEKAVNFDLSIRKYPGISGQAFLYKTARPLSSINFDFHPSLFPELIEECTGLCGL